MMAVKGIASRVHGCRKILGELVRLRGKVERAATGRLQSDVELQWLGSAADALETLITAGNVVLPGQADPRTWRTARKRPRPETSDREAEFRWQYGRYGNG